MFNRIRQLGLSALLAIFVISTAGCVPLLIGAAAGAGGYAWTKGTLKKQFDVTAEKLRQAAVKGLKKLSLPVNEDEHDRLTAKIVSEFSDGHKVKINIEAVTERTTKIEIRVGFFGHKTRSEMILNSIQEYL